MDFYHYKNAGQIIDSLFEGGQDGFVGSSAALSNTWLKGKQLIHFSTPILERSEGTFIFNETKYSVQTNRLQKTILMKLQGKQFSSVHRVPMDYKGSLESFLQKWQTIHLILIGATTMASSSNSTSTNTHGQRIRPLKENIFSNQVIVTMPRESIYATPSSGSHWLIFRNTREISNSTFFPTITIFLSCT